MAFPADPNADLLSFYEPIVTVVLVRIRDFLLPPSVQLIPGNFGGPLAVYTYASLLLSVLVSSPVLAWQAWEFVKPAFSWRPGRKVPAVALALFLAGCAFGFFLMCPAVVWGMVAFFPYAGVSANYVDAMGFYSMVFWVTLVCGFSFEVPVAVWILARYAGLDPKSLTRRRRYLWGVTYIVSAVVTPDSNVLADFVLFVPMIAMIEVSSWLIARSLKKPGEKKKEKGKKGPWRPGSSCGFTGPL